MSTKSLEVRPISLGEEDDYYADFDPPNMTADGSVLDGRTIKPGSVPTAVPSEGSIVALEVVGTPTIVTSPVLVNGRTIEAGTGVKVRVRAKALMPNNAEGTVKVSTVLTDDSAKSLGLRFKVEQ